MTDQVDSAVPDGQALAAFELAHLDEECLLLTAEGEIDDSNAQELVDLLTRARTWHPRLLVVDLNRVEYCSSAGLGALIGANVAAQGVGARLAVVAATRAVRRPIELLGLGSQLPLYDSVEAVRATLAG